MSDGMESSIGYLKGQAEFLRQNFGEDCPDVAELDRAAAELQGLRELVSTCQDWLCDGAPVTKPEHGERMKIINAALDGES